MKFQINDAVRSSASALNFDEALEALVEVSARCGDAYAEVLACESRCAEAQQVVDDCSLALESINRFGVTAQTMSIFNKDGNLSNALGLESLALESLETATAASKKLLKADYSAALEGALGNAWNKVVEFLKSMWEAIKRFFAELFDRNAKMLRLVKEAVDGKKYQNFSDKKKVAVLTKDQVAAATLAAGILGRCINVATPLATLVKMASAEGVIKAGFAVKDNLLVDEKSAEVFKVGEADVVSKFGWTGADATTYAKTFITFTSAGEMKKSLKNAEKCVKEAIAAAEKAAKADNADQAAKDKAVAMAKEATDKAKFNRSCISAYAKLISRIGTTLLKLAKVSAADLSDVEGEDDDD